MDTLPDAFGALSSDEQERAISRRREAAPAEDRRLVDLIASAMEASGKAARRMSWGNRARAVINLIERAGYEIRQLGK